MYRDETILETADVRVRILTLDIGLETPWHSHTAVTDHMLCLSGVIEIECREPGEQVVLEPGGRCEVAVGRVHRVVNRGAVEAKYLLVQGVGRYDFIKAENPIV